MLAAFFIAVLCILGGVLVALGGLFVNSYAWYLRDAVYDDPTVDQQMRVLLLTIGSYIVFALGVLLLWKGSAVLAILMAAFGVFYGRFRLGVQPLLNEDRRKRLAGELGPTPRPKGESQM